MVDGGQDILVLLRGNKSDFAKNNSRSSTMIIDLWNALKDSWVVHDESSSSMALKLLLPSAAIKIFHFLATILSR